MYGEFSKNFIKGHEALRLFVYDDADGLPIVPGKLVKGHPTIGWGRCLDTNGVSREEADFLFENDFIKAETVVGGIFGLHIFNEKKERIAAMLSMALNLGKGGFGEFKNMISAIKERKWKEAARHARDSVRWRNQLRRRAEEEARMLEED